MGSVERGREVAMAVAAERAVAVALAEEHVQWERADVVAAVSMAAVAMAVGMEVAMMAALLPFQARRGQYPTGWQHRHPAARLRSPVPQQRGQGKHHTCTRGHSTTARRRHHRPSYLSTHLTSPRPRRLVRALA